MAAIEESKYRKDPALSVSDLKVYASEGFRNFFFYKFGEEEAKKPSVSMEFGSLVHLAVLEPQRFEQEVLVKDINRPKSNNMESFVEKVIKGAEVVDAYRSCYATQSLREDEVYNRALTLYKELQGYIESKRDNKMVIDTATGRVISEIKERVIRRVEEALGRRAWEEGLKEQTLFSTFLSSQNKILPIKGKVDLFWIDDKTLYLVDLKTTRNTTPAEFSKSIYQYKYLEQLFWYGYLINSYFTDIEEIHYYLIAIGNTAPHAVEYYKIHRDKIEEEGKNNIVALVDQLIDDMEKVGCYQDYLALCKQGEKEVHNFYQGYKDRAMNTPLYPTELFSSAILIDDEVPAIL